MQPLALRQRWSDRLLLVVVAALLAAVPTALEVRHPSWQQVSSSLATVVNRLPHATLPAATTSGSTKPTAAAATSTPAAPAAQPAPVKTALTNSYVHPRSGKSVTSTIITNLPAGTTVQLRDDADTTWQGVTYQGKTGYIYRAYLQY